MYAYMYAARDTPRRARGASSARERQGSAPDMLRGRSLAVAVGSGGLLCGCCVIVARRPAAACSVLRVATRPGHRLLSDTTQPLDPQMTGAATSAIQMLITLPEGVLEGQKLRVQAPGGRAVLITVPRGATAGTQLQVQVPASPTPAASPTAHSSATGASSGDAGRPASPLICTEAHPSLTTWENGDVERTCDGGPPWRAARCQDIIPAEGSHFAQFTVKHQLIAMHFGIIRPNWDTTSGKDPHNVCDHIFFDAIDGRRWPNSGEQSWAGQQGAKVGDRIGLLLDRSEGSLSIYKNDVRLGMIVPAGLSGEYCWAVSLYNKDDRVRIEALTPPGLWTQEDELD